MPIALEAIELQTTKMKSPLALFVQLVAALLIPGKLFWPYFTAAAILVMGLAKIHRVEIQRAHGIDRAVVFGPLFFAMPTAVFGADHFVFTQTVAAIMPSWIPGHLFWVYFVGVALVAASLSIVTKQYSVLAATLLSAMLFLFVLLLQVPVVAVKPGSRFEATVMLRDLCFSDGALACALTRADQWPQRMLSTATILVRYAVALPAVVFGVEHFLYPEFVPVVPLKQLLPSWIPGHLSLAYVTGTVLVFCGASMIVPWKGRMTATWLGAFVFVIVVLVYLPITVANISDIGTGLNYMADTLAFSGSALLLAGVLPSGDQSEVPAASRTESGSCVNVPQSDVT